MTLRDQLGKPRKPLIEWVREQISAHNSDECLLWPFWTNEWGYGRVKMNGKQETVHRVAFFMVNGRWPEPCGLHTCDTPACFNPRHIVEGTQGDNSLDRNRKGRQARGEKSGRAKLTEEQVRAIRSEYVFGKPGHSTPALAKKYGMNPSVIFRIITKQIWSHV